MTENANDKEICEIVQHVETHGRASQYEIKKCEIGNVKL